MSESSLAFAEVVVKGVTRLYGPTRALNNVSLTLRAGQVTTLEGPNGAGKSTLLSVLATLAKPTAGSVLYGEYDPLEDLDVIRPAIGLVAHEALVYPDLTAREALALSATFYDLDDADALVARALKEHRLTDFASRAARTLSRGQLQRLALARATLHDPTLLLFDEPTTGLDAESTERVAEAILASRAAGRIVAVVTHDRELAERVADVRVFLERGRVARSARNARTTQPAE